MSLDDLLGPMAPPRYHGPKVFVPPKSTDGSVTQNSFVTQKTLMDAGVKHQVIEKKEDKKRARSEKQEAEAEEKRVKSLPHGIEKEMRAVARLIEKRPPPLEEEEGGLERDGSEIPPTFTVTAIDNDSLNAISADAAYADRKDRDMAVSLYYSQGCFPTDVLVQFLTYNGRIKLADCEIAFVFKGTWWRNKRFKTMEQLQKFIQTSNPERIDIGPSHDPGKGRCRYLVFDTDLEDRTIEHPSGYIRNCACRGSRQVCSLGCWFYMQVAVKCLTYVSRNVLGAKHVMPVASGRRGVHTWLLDEQFLQAGEDERKGIVNRIEMLGRPWIYNHQEYTPYLYTYILKPAFEAHFLDGQKLILDQETTLYLLHLAAISDAGYSDDVHVAIAAMHHARTFLERKAAWKILCGLVPDKGGFKKRVIFELLYPRLDGQVTTAMTHCVKAPFVVHPDSRRCSVPIPNIDTWRPDQSPRLSEVATSIEDLANPYGWSPDGRAAASGAILTGYVNHMRDMISSAFPSSIMMTMTTKKTIAPGKK